MQKLYDALIEAHPGHEVIDVKFMANPGEASDQKACDMDSEFSRAIQEAVEVSATSFE